MKLRISEFPNNTETAREETVVIANLQNPWRHVT